MDQDIITVYKIAENRMYKIKLMESKSIRNSIISSLMKALHEHSLETEAHSNRLIEFSKRLGIELGLSADQIHNLKLLALLHDIGITGIPESILSKNGELTSEEWNIMKEHCEIGYRIANSSSDLAHIAIDILSHHEQWDGNGYPLALAGDSIPLNSRVISVLDTYDSMINEGIHREPVSKRESLEFIRSQAGKYFDPKIVEVFIKIMKE